MKRLLIGMLSVLAVAGTATAVKAEQDTQVYGDPSDGGAGYTYDTPNNLEAQRTDTDMQQPGMDMQQPNMDMQQPGTDMQQPNMDMQQPGTDMQQPNMDMQRPGADTQPDAYDSLSRPNTMSESSYQATPFELSHLAYRGYFEDQGIRGYSTFIQDVGNGNVDAADIVAAGVESGMLAPSVMEDEGYENSLRFMLQRLRVPGDS